MASDLPQQGLNTFRLLLALAVLAVGAVFSPLWQPLLLAAVFAGALRPLHQRLTRALGGRHNLAAGVTTAGLALLVLLPLASMVTFLVREAISLEGTLRTTLQAKGLQGLLELVPDRAEPWLAKLLGALPDQLGSVAEQAADKGLAAAAAVGGALSKTSELAFDALMMIVALFFLLTDGPRLVGWLQEVSPLGAEATGQLLADLRRTATATLVSMVATAGVQSLAALVGYLVARVPHPLFFATLTFFAAFIPSVGTAVVALPLAVFVMLTGRLGWGIFLAVWGLAVVGSVDNVLKPMLARGGTELDGVLVFFAMIGGILFFGAAGLLVGPLALTFFIELVKLGRRYQAPALNNPGPGQPS